MLLSLSWRNVWRNRTRSLIIVASVAIGLFAGLFVLGLYDGMLRSRVRTVIDMETAHIQIHHPRFKEDYDAALTIEGLFIKDRLSKIPDIVHIATRSITQGMLATANGSSGIQINGVVMDDENAVSQLNKKIKEGTALTADKKNSILVGKKLARKLKLKPGAKLVLTFTDIDGNITSGAFRVSGIYQTDNSPMDERNAYINQAVLNSYLGTDTRSHEIAIILSTDQRVGEVKSRLQTMFPDLKVQDWKENSPETELMVSTVDEYSSIIIVIIMIALAFGIVNTMLMSVLERTREIGMLAALGMNQRKVFVLILSETVLLTIVGVPIGLAFAWLTIQHYSTAGIDISAISSEVMSGFGFSSIIYPRFPLGQIPDIIVIVAGTALVSSLFPSLKAIRLQPADALRQ